MSLTVCPAAVVAAPVESVWELLSDPTLCDEWWDARTKRIVSEGQAAHGQVLYAKTSAFGRTWDVTLRVETVHPEQHQIQLRVALPLGIVKSRHHYLHTARCCLLPRAIWLRLHAPARLVGMDA